MSPSASAFDATMGVGRRGPPTGPGRGPRTLGPPTSPGGGPISICSLSQRSANVACTSRISPTNISYAVFCLKKKKETHTNHALFRLQHNDPIADIPAASGDGSQVDD